MSKDPKQPQIKSIEVEFVDAQQDSEQDFTFERIEDDYAENYFSFESLKNALGVPEKYHTTKK